VRTTLDNEDWFRVGSLKHLRTRSMNNPRWRNADLLARHLKRWDSDSPLDAQRMDAQRSVGEFRKATRRGDEAAQDERWREVRASVDRLIEDADRLAGRRIPDNWPL
jgi:hypothetical protein